MTQEIEKPEGEGKEEQTPLFKEGELHIVTSPDHVVVPGVGFVEAPGKASIAVGNEKMVLDHLRSLGFSEEAIAAFKSGKVLQAEVIETPFGDQVVTEQWEGKDTPKTNDQQ